MIAYSRRKGTRILYGDVLASNGRMLELATDCGFVQEGTPVDGVVRIAAKLDQYVEEPA